MSWHPAAGHDAFQLAELAHAVPKLQPAVSPPLMGNQLDSADAASDLVIDRIGPLFSPHSGGAK
eukprot:15448312-Alexandrium_andersonii.AAC.1